MHILQIIATFKTEYFIVFFCPYFLYYYFQLLKKRLCSPSRPNVLSKMTKSLNAASFSKFFTRQN